MNLVETKIHFVGIGGIGMSGIAEVLVNMGCRVSGSDALNNSQIERLKKFGVEVQIGHEKSHLPLECDAVVYSSAVKMTNPELQEAKRRKIPVIQRAEMLAELMRLKRGIAIAGTHGKTTTTSMTAAVMLAAKLDPTIVVGGRLDLIKSTAALGKGEWFLAEADESDGSFLRLSPEIVVVTNIDNDHLDNYGDFSHLESAFGEFISKIPFYGRAILGIDSPPVEKLSRKHNKRILTYGFSPNAKLRAVEIKMENGIQFFSVLYDGKKLGFVNLHVPGYHNVLDSLAAIAVGLELQMDFKIISEGLSEFKGVDRRLQRRGEYKGVIIMDDYGHHPTEVVATLKGLRQLFPKKRIVTVFQPHRYTRTKICWDQFLKCFKDSEVIGFLDIYSAGEKRIKGIDSKNLAKAVGKKHRNSFYWGDMTKAKSEIMGLVGEGDIVLTLGAGDVWKIGQDLCEQT